MGKDLIQCLTTLSMKNIFQISNLNPPWHNLRPFSLVLSLIIWQKRLIHKLLSGSCRKQQGKRLGSILLLVLCIDTPRRCWPTLARNDQHAPEASQGSSHTLQDSRTLCTRFVFVHKGHRLCFSTELFYLHPTAPISFTSTGDGEAGN